MYKKVSGWWLLLNLENKELSKMMTFLVFFVAEIDDFPEEQGFFLGGIFDLKKEWYKKILLFYQNCEDDSMMFRLSLIHWNSDASLQYVYKDIFEWKFDDCSKSEVGPINIAGSY